MAGKKNINSKNEEKLSGFTLIEMVVYTAVVVVVLTVVISFFLLSLNIKNKSQASNETQDNARKAMERIVYETRSALAVYTPTSVFNSSSSQLSLITKLDLPAGENITYADFYLDSGKLFLKKEGKDAEQLTSDKIMVNDLNFKYLTSTSTDASIQIGLTVDYNSTSSLRQLQARTSLKTAATIRAY